MQIVVNELELERIDKYLAAHTEYSRATIQKMIEKEAILLNGKPTKANAMLKASDVLTIEKCEEEPFDLTPEAIPLDIVYENDHLLVINKPSGLVVHPGSGNPRHTLVNALLHYTNTLSDCNGTFRPGIVHRIDKDTSGLLLVAKTNQAHELLAKEFQTKGIKRKYIALVKGVLKHNHITIDAPIGRDSVDRKKMKVTAENSKHAVTHVTVLKRYKRYTLISCELETGRTHQIRVHLAYIGYPLVNDPVYQNDKCTPFGQFLHSSELTFVEPITKEQMHFTAPLPKEFQDFLDYLEKEEH